MIIWTGGIRKRGFSSPLDIEVTFATVVAAFDKNIVNLNCRRPLLVKKDSLVNRNNQ